MNSTLYCSKCGRVNTRSRKVCKGCGNSLTNRTSLAIRQKSEDISSQYRYLIVPFVGHLSSGVFSVDNAHKVTMQLQELIDQYSHQGWDFYRIDKVNIQVTPGCLASLLGAQVSFITFDQVVFRQSVNENRDKMFDTLSRQESNLSTV